MRCPMISLPQIWIPLPDESAGLGHAGTLVSFRSLWTGRSPSQGRGAQGAETRGSEARGPGPLEGCQNAPGFVPQIGRQMSGLGGHDPLGNLSLKHSPMLELRPRLQEAMTVAVAKPVV